ncbi:LLM class flavin-dependent oxidoreductase, partial [Cellulomonas septica]|nr:LLM class flavin-dependent oxidoreductase [Cellulomonas septica]
MPLDVTIPLSVLDTAPLSAGQSSADALAATTRLARAADALGYRRFWVAEHHAMPMVASTSPGVLLAHLAAATRSRIDRPSASARARHCATTGRGSLTCRTRPRVMSALSTSGS